jgi:hypothetical protein
MSNLALLDFSSAFALGGVVELRSYNLVILSKDAGKPQGGPPWGFALPSAFDAVQRFTFTPKHALHPVTRKLPCVPVIFIPDRAPQHSAGRIFSPQMTELVRNKENECRFSQKRAPMQ